MAAAGRVARVVLDSPLPQLDHLFDYSIPEELAADYLALSATVGMRVRAELPGGGVLAGTATGIDPYGRLLIARVDGETQAVGAGDIVHLRPLT